MIRRILLFVVPALLMMALVAPAVLAESAGERACEADGGTWTPTGPGQFECVHETTTSGPTPGTGNDPKDTAETTQEPQQGQGVGGGAKDEPIQLHCEYSQSGKLFANKSDPGCPDPQPTS